MRFERSPTPELKDEGAASKSRPGASPLARRGARVSASGLVACVVAVACWSVEPGVPQSPTESFAAGAPRQPLGELAEVTVRSPPPARPAPVNLRLVALAMPHGADLALEGAALVRGEARVPGALEPGRSPRELLIRLPEHSGPCAPLCPDAEYELELPGGPRVADGPRGSVRTGTSADWVLPVVTSTRVLDRGGRAVVEIAFSEPVLARAIIAGPELERRAVPLPPSVSDELEFEPPHDWLSEGVEYLLEISAEDLAGNTAEPLTLRLQASARIAVLITEIVVAPLHDWNDTTGGGVPFDDEPGTGPVTDGDQWVEVLNVSPFPIDLTTADLVLRTVDGSPSETPLTPALPARFGDGGAAERWWPGETMVFKPRGHISRREFSLELVSGGRSLDRVVVGDLPGSVALRGVPPDAVHESLTRLGAESWAFCRPSPGDPAPPADCA